MTEKKNVEIQEIEIKKLKSSPFNVRRENVVVGELAKNIKENGLENPIVVRPCSKGKFEVVSGKRRLTAMKSLNKNKISAIIRRDLTDKQAMINSFSENLMRDNLTKEEESIAIAQMLGRNKLLKKVGVKPIKFDKAFTENDLAKQLGIGRQAVNKKLEPLRQSATTRDMVKNGRITEETARVARQFAKDEKTEEKLVKAIGKQEMKQEDALDVLNKAKKKKQSVDDLIKKIEGKDELTDKDLEVDTTGSKTKSKKDADNGDKDEDFDADKVDVGDLDIDVDAEEEKGYTIQFDEKVDKSLERYAEDNKTTVEKTITHAVKKLLSDKGYDVE